MTIINVGVIGCGSIARFRHIPEYDRNPHVKLVAFADGHIDRAKEMVEVYGGNAYDNYLEMLTSEHIDAVSVCTPHAFHAPISIDALKRNIHVLCEKPMAVSQKEAEEMIQATKTSKGQLMIAYNQRYMPPHLKAKEIINSGKLGRILTFRCMFGHGGPEQWSIEKENTWFFSQKQGFIGSLGDLGVHKLDLLTWLLNDPIIEVSAFMGTLQKKANVDDNASIIARTSSGAIGTIMTSWTHTPGEDNSTILHFQRGTMKIATDPVYPLIIENMDGSVEKYQLDPLVTNAETAQINSGVIDAFIDAIIHNKPVPISGEEGLHAIQVVLAALKSSKERKTVSIDYSLPVNMK